MWVQTQLLCLSFPMRTWGMHILHLSCENVKKMKWDDHAWKYSTGSLAMVNIIRLLLAESWRRWVQGDGGFIRVSLFLYPKDLWKEMEGDGKLSGMWGRMGTISMTSSPRMCQPVLRALSCHLSQCFQPPQLTSSWWPGRRGIRLVAGCFCRVWWPRIKGREAGWDGGLLGLEGATGAREEQTQVLKQGRPEFWSWFCP